MAVIDGTNMILGRLASVVASRILLGERIDVVNCENVVISGEKRMNIGMFKHKIERGTPAFGPHYPRHPHMIVKRTVRGMVPHRREKGEKALRLLRCYMGIPSQFHGQKIETLEKANVNKLPNFRFIKLKDLSVQLGAKLG